MVEELPALSHVSQKTVISFDFAQGKLWARAVVAEIPFEGAGSAGVQGILRLRRAIPRGFAQDDKAEVIIGGKKITFFSVLKVLPWQPPGAEALIDFRGLTRR